MAEQETMPPRWALLAPMRVLVERHFDAEPWAERPIPGACGGCDGTVTFHRPGWRGAPDTRGWSRVTKHLPGCRWVMHIARQPQAASN